ncbi:MAG: hypothetical protein K2O78_07905 [Muribaculaceae bacterium]|nr:hypothetical protein [Muribaculaceae bacterium]
MPANVMPPLDATFVSRHLKDDPQALRLKFCSGRDLSPERREALEFAITQIECRRRFAQKFRTLLSDCPDFLFASQLAGEQASHLWVSRLHAVLAERYRSGQARQYALFDMTAGLGIDFMCIAAALCPDHGSGALAADIDPLKAEVLRHNLGALGLEKAEVLYEDSMQQLRSMPERSVEILFADPARRGEADRRIYDPADCLPDVTGQWPVLLAKADTVIIKNSPMIDVDKALSLFPGTVRVVIVSVRNECKEVLVVARDGAEFEGIDAINILDDPSSGYPSAVQWVSIPDSERKAVEGIPLVDSPQWLAGRIASDGGIWLYEPNSSLMKCHPWQYLAERYPGLIKASPNCHIWFSTIHYPDFPGRALRVTSIPAGKNPLRGERLNIVSRNHPLSPDAIARKYRITPGGTGFLYALTAGAQESPLMLRTL